MTIAPTISEPEVEMDDGTGGGTFGDAEDRSHGERVRSKIRSIEAAAIASCVYLVLAVVALVLWYRPSTGRAARRSPNQVHERTFRRVTEIGTTAIGALAQGAIFLFLIGYPAGYDEETD
jgi:hypothetical protein